MATNCSNGTEEIYASVLNDDSTVMSSVKTLHISIISVFMVVIFASINTGYGQSIPNVNYNQSYKISDIAGDKDWNPRTGTLVVSNENKLYQFTANGTMLSPLYVANFSISDPRFNYDGSKVAFLNAGDVYSYPADIYVLDLNSHNVNKLTSGANAFELSWTPDGNIIYSQNSSNLSFPYKISVLDLKNNSSSTILDSIYNLHGIDVSHDGTKLVFAANYTGKNCTRSYYAQCFDHLFIYDLKSNNKTFSEIAKTDTYKAHPRWSADDSFITYTLFNGFGGIYAVTPDGQNEVTLIDRGKHLANYDNAVFNKNETVIAYNKGFGGIDYSNDFNLQDAGLHYTFTDRCSNNNCQLPSVPEFPVVSIILAISFVSMLIFYRVKLMSLMSNS
jgi:Tol biopolymer transport system component